MPIDPAKTCTRKEAADRTGLGAETLRFYEQRGLLAKPKRSASGYRLYFPVDLDRLRFIKRAQELGFSLKEIKDLLKITSSPQGTPARIRQLASTKRDLIRERIKGLRAMERSLTSLVNHCSGSGPLDLCPIVTHLRRTTGKGCHE